MASRAVFSRRRIKSDYLNNCSLISTLKSTGPGHLIENTESKCQDLVTNNSLYLNCIEESDSVSAFKYDLYGFPYSWFFRQEFRRVPISIHGTVMPDFISPFGTRVMLQSIRNASTATAGKPEMDGDDEEREVNIKKTASPEECDQAVEGLSTAKAKANSKRLYVSQNFARIVLQRVWTIILKIGPALKAVAFMDREDWKNKLVHWKKAFVSTLQHYWLGFKLLGTDLRICSKLLLKLAAGKSLSRRERQQLTRTTIDIFRLVPFAVFIIVPFMEFLLPVFLKLFPNMLPSTFQDKMKEQESLKRKLNARIEYAKFLQETAKEMSKEIQNSSSGDLKRTAEDLDEFLSRVRKGCGVTNDEILGFAKLFNDELTLDNINRPRLVNMCKYMGISPFGTDGYLRYMLRKKLQRIKNDDKLIQLEGVESLSESELREDCLQRGMLGDLPIEEMRQQLRDWLDLSLNQSVPSSLLILSRAFMVPGKLRPEEAVGATLSSLPDEVVDTVGVTSLPSEDTVSERRRKLEYLEMQEELIQEEEKREREEEDRSRMETFEIKEEDLALKEMSAPASREAEVRVRGRALDKQEQLCELSRALVVLSAASSVSREREDFLRLVNKEIEVYNSMVEKDSTSGEQDAMRAYRAAREGSEAPAAAGDEISSALVNRVDAMLENLEKEIDDVDAKIGTRWRLLDRDYDGKVSPEEVASAAIYLKNTLGKEGIQELISSLSKDKDGKILVEDIVKLGSRMEDLIASKHDAKP